MKNSFNLECEFNTIKVRGKNVQTYVMGRGEKVVLSFPGFPHSGLIYSLFLLNYDLSKVKLITFDLPGWIGMTESFNEGGDFLTEDIMEIVEAIIKEYNIKRYSVIGYSYGTMLSLMLINKYPDRVSKLALISPVVKSESSREDFKLNLIKYPIFSFVAKPYLISRFEKYSKPLEEEGVPKTFISSYRDMVHNTDGKVLYNSLNILFTQDNTSLLESLRNREVLIANSRNETDFFRKQAGYIRRYLNSEQSLYLEGDHQDFILHPKAEVVRNILDYLIT